MKSIHKAYDCIPHTKEAKQILVERAQQLAIKKSHIVSTVDQQLYMRFRIGINEHYGIPFEYATEVMQNQYITPIPNVPDYIEGMINHRGMLLTIFHLGKLFKLSNNIDKENNIIIVEHQSISIGIYADHIEGTHTYDSKKTFHGLTIKGAVNPDLVLGINDETTILNIENLLTYLTSLLKNSNR